MSVKGFLCKGCGTPGLLRVPMQRYCEPCSDSRNLQRVTSCRPNKQIPSHRDRQKKLKECGVEISKTNQSALMSYRKDVDLIWQIRVSVPFDWAASKNHIFALRRVGHVALRREAVNYKNALILTIKASLNRPPKIKVVQNKVWLDIFVQKSNHRGDAANFVDLICDAVKEAIGVDDRWFSIRHLDWEICKDNPRIFVAIGQETDVAVSVCSSCGRLLQFSEFQKNNYTPTGVGRTCKDCSKVGDRARRTELKTAR